MNNEELYRKSLEHFGPLRQFDKAMEEAAELILAIQKWRYNPTGENRDNVHEEIADLEIVIAQLKLMLAEPLIEKYRTDKLKRLAKIIK